MAAAGKFVGGGAEAEAVLRALRDAPRRHAEHDVSGEARDAGGKWTAGGGAGGGAAGKPAATPAPAAKGDKPAGKKFGKSKAKVTLSSPAGDPKATAERVSHLFGRHPGRDPGALADVASAAGAPDDAEVTVDLHPKTGLLRVRVDHPDFEQTCVRYFDEKNGVVFAKNEIIDIKESARGSGLGSDIFARQVENCRELGAKEIRCHAARRNGAGDSYFNGYYTWPRLGYDQTINEIGDDGDDGDADLADLFEKCRKEFPKAKTVLDIFSAPGGRDWWKENGEDLTHARFDLSEGSRSLKVFGAYLDEREKRKAAASA